MFKIFGLQKNMENIKAVVCTKGFIWGHQGDAAYKRRDMGEGGTFRERNRTMVSCEEYGATMAAPPLRHHM